MPLTLVACERTPQLHVKQAKGVVRIDVGPFGSKPPRVSSLRLREVQSGSTVWAVREKKTMRLWRIDLRAGSNQAMPLISRGSAEVMVPAGLDSFRLAPGIDYDLEVCGGMFARSCVSQRVRIP
jgi:hypothetical protein